jgi:membrane associated rhomboid family serine protease
MAFGLILVTGVAAVLGRLAAKFHLPSLLSVVFGVTAGISGVIGIVLVMWARQEHWFLTKPDPERPPEIFKNKP